MITLACIAGYIILGLITGRVVFFTLLGGKATGEDDMFFTLMASLMWPVTILILVIFLLGTGAIALMTAPTPKLPKVNLKALNREKAKPEPDYEFIERAERELKIGEYQ